MNEFTDKNEQAFLEACGAIGAEPNAMFNTQKERYLDSEFLKNPVSWLETEILYHSYTTRREAQEVANGIDRMISEGAPVGQSKLFPRRWSLGFGRLACNRTPRQGEPEKD